MAHEGMVHALEETRRLLKPEGVLVNIVPVPEGYFIEAQLEGKTHFSEPKRYTLSEDVLQADAAVEQVLERGLFLMDETDEFEFLTYSSSVPEMRAYWAEQSTFEDEPPVDEGPTREDSLYAQVEEILDDLGDGAEVVIRERVRIARLLPAK